MGKIIGILGLLARVMAMSSLILGAFHQPIYPYMRSVMGGIMEVYLLMRDYIFASLGWIFSSWINFIGQWLTWLPHAPWFSLDGVLADITFLYAIAAAVTFQGLYTEENVRLKSHHVFQRIWWRLSFLLRIVGHSLLWPKVLYTISKTYGREKEAVLKDAEDLKLTAYGVGAFTEGAIRVRSDLTKAFISTISGSILFFLFVYAENKIGL